MNRGRHTKGSAARTARAATTRPGKAATPRPGKTATNRPGKTATRPAKTAATRPRKTANRPPPRSARPGRSRAAAASAGLRGRLAAAFPTIVPRAGSTAAGRRGRSTAAARAAARKARRPVVLAACFAAFVVATNFPFASLFSQGRQLSAATAQLAQLRHQNSLLAEQQQQLSNQTEVRRLAREDYQLVPAGQSLYEILPPAGQRATLPAGSPMAGDPANQPLVPPSQAPNMTPDPGLPQAPTAAASATPAAGANRSGAAATVPTSFWARVTSTLEFWK